MKIRLLDFLSHNSMNFIPYLLPHEVYNYESSHKGLSSEGWEIEHIASIVPGFKN
jgi:hypothetical protein